MKDFSYITNSHPSYIESLYQDFLKDSSSIDPDLKKFFEGFDFAVANGSASAGVSAGTSVSQPTTDTVDWMKEIRVYRLILG